ncbi:DUF748 domain-containing protein [Nitrospira sp. Nam80]
MTLLYRFRHLILTLILVVGLYALLGFVVAPYLVKRYGVQAVSEKLQRPVLLHDVQINPFALSIRLTGFEIQEPDHRAILGFDELFIDFEALISLFKQAYAFNEINVVLPFVSARILPDKKLNLLGLLPPRSETPPPPPARAEKAEIPLVQVGLIQIQSGVLEFRDESKKKPVMIDVVPIEILLRNFSTKPGKENPYAFTAEFGQGETFSWNGTFSLEPLESDGTISLANIDLLTFWRGVQDRFKFDLKSAALDLDIRYSFDLRADPINFRVNDGKLALRDFRLAERGGKEPLISIPSIKIDEMRLDLAGRDIKMGTIKTDQGRIRGWLEPDGSVNYVPLLASPDSEDRDVPAPPSGQAPAQTKEAEPWSVMVKTVQVNDYGVTFEDRSLSPTAQMSIEDMRVTVKDVRVPFAKPMNVAVGLTLNKTGHVETEGSMGLNPMRADLRLNLSHIRLMPFQPYADRFVQADIDGGELHLDGAVRYAEKHVDEPLLAYDGKVSITDFELADRASKKPAVSWDSLALTKMAIRLNPTSVKVGEIEWRAPSIQVVKDADGTLNLSRIAGGSGAAPAKPPKAKKVKTAGKAPMPPVAFDTVKLVKMDMTFVDQSIEPPVITGIQELTGTIKGLSSKEVARAKVSLAGKVDKIAPMKIQGQINPLSETSYTDLKVLFDNVNLIAASPYAGKYAGYPITKGKLYLDLMYQVSKNQLHGENKVVIDQFTFGEKTDSPDATSLPVRLAVALLKDRQGKIEIDLPVRGDLNEPDFKYGQVLLDALVNLITKVAASPFAAIGNLVGGNGEELQYVAFDPGSAELTDADRGKLQTLEKALNERPALRLEVEGRADPSLDGRALAQQKVEAAMLARYAKTNKKAAASPPSADRRLELLNELYIEQFGKQPMKREEIARGKAVERVMSGEEVMNELAATRQVTEVELRQLAQNRAVRIREFLVGENHAGQERPGETANQGHQETQAKQQHEGNRTDQLKESDQDIPSDQDKGAQAEQQPKREREDNHMSEDRVFLLDVELGASGGEQVRCKLNLSGA